MKKTITAVAICCLFLVSWLAVGQGDHAYAGDAIDIKKLYLYIEDDDLQHLYSREVFSDEPVAAYAKTSPDGEELDLRGVRFRGSSTRLLPKKPYNVRFEERQDFLNGSNRMNLNAMYTDPSMMREKLSMDMFRELGHPAPRAQYFELYINDIFEGLYIQIERVDADLLKNAGLNGDGTLVRDQFRDNRHKPEIDRASLFGFNIDAIEDKEEFLEENFDYRNKPEWSRLADLAQWVYNTPPGPEFARGFEERFNLENFIDWLAIHILIGDIDAYGDDYWLYLDHNDPEGKWMVIPWDKDLTFGSHTRLDVVTANDFFAYEYSLEPGWHGWDNDLVKKFLQTPELKDLLDKRLIYLMEQKFTPDYFKEKTKLIQRAIENSVNVLPGEDSFILHPQNHHGELGRHAYHVESIVDFVELRYQFLDRQINSHDGLPYTATAPLSGLEEVFLTDLNGWVIAKLKLDQPVETGEVTIRADEAVGIDGVERIWTIDTKGANIKGELSLYYRNDYPDWYGNWYTDLAAVGNQWNLNIAERINGEEVIYPSMVNPYSNKVTAEVELDGLHEFVVIHGVSVIELKIGEQEASINGKVFTLDAEPFITEEERTMVPVRFVSEALGAEVNWASKTRQVIIKDGDTEIIMPIDGDAVTVNGVEDSIDAPAEIVDGSAFVPLRFVSDKLGAAVDYDAASGKITLTR
ncbi:CotH kinase family protein [Desulfofalx alkaliphila]|uniref:CotH kinase family protein n=1 Tax=Desulfofalx alkaliphila TaxID=105483 RepID=UPI0004E10D06|nr:CotH kinase family protein [Desulfofalx alkaliphila]